MTKLFHFVVPAMLLLATPLPSLAGWFSDDTDKLCYDWYGNREACGRNQVRRESVFAGQLNSYYGDQTASMTGGFGEGVTITTVRSQDSLRFLFGGQFIYSAANSYISGTTYSTVLMAGDLIFGLSIKPLKDSYLKPVIEFDALVGLKSIQFGNPPSGVNEKNLKPSIGGKVLIGIDIPIGKLYAIRPALDYQVNRISGIVSGESFVLDALGFSIGLVFL